MEYIIPNSRLDFFKYNFVCLFQVNLYFDQSAFQEEYNEVYGPDTQVEKCFEITTNICPSGFHVRYLKFNRALVEDPMIFKK